MIQAQIQRKCTWERALEDDPILLDSAINQKYVIKLGGNPLINIQKTKKHEHRKCIHSDDSRNAFLGG